MKLNLCILIILVFGPSFNLISCTENQEFNLKLVDVKWKNPQLGGDPRNPGARIELMERGLNYANSEVFRVFRNQIWHIKLQKIEKLFDTGYLAAEKAKITDFEPFSFSHQLISPNRDHSPLYLHSITLATPYSHVVRRYVKAEEPGSSRLHWESSGGRVSIRGDWSGYKTFELWGLKKKILKSGTFYAIVRNLNIQIEANLIKSSAGQPEVAKATCRANFGSMYLDVEGGVIAFFINLFRQKIAVRLKPILEGKLCETAKRLLENDVNARLRTFPTKTEFGQNFFLDYSLLFDPRVFPKSISFLIKGEIGRLGQEGARFYPQKLAESQKCQNSMLKISISDFLANSLLSQAHLGGLLTFCINHETFPAVSEFFSTSCSGDLCLGTIIPQLKNQYPYSYCQLRFESYNEPSVRLTESRAILEKLMGRLSLEVRENKTVTKVAVIDFSIRAYLTLMLHPSTEKIAGKIKIAQILWALSRSTIGNVRQMALQEVVDYATPLLEDVANQRLGQGIPLPLINGIKMKNVQMIFLNRTVEICSDVDYSGSGPKNLSDFVNDLLQY